MDTACLFVKENDPLQLKIDRESVLITEKKSKLQIDSLIVRFDDF